ncbi:MAG: hypothetical protein M1404_03875 [Acidobacteria bacterium]|nr:hypothetical protein [Acidobacteriota bacterium]
MTKKLHPNNRFSRRDFLRQGALLAPVGAMGFGGRPAGSHQTTARGGAVAQGKLEFLPRLAAHGVNLDDLQSSLRLACTWITDVAQMRGDQLTIEKNFHDFPYKHWRGAIRGEYSAALRQWSFFAPVWHTGQAIKALVFANEILQDPSLLKSAQLGAGFIGEARIVDPKNKNHGLIWGAEGDIHGVNTSCILECLDGLMLLAKTTGETKYWKWVEEAVAWVARNAYMGQGVFRDDYSVRQSRWVNPPGDKWFPYMHGRPLIDDAIFLKAFKHTGIQEYRRIFYETSDRLLRDESPPGNWINYPPCNPLTGSFHPRQAYWWGYPQIAAYKDSGNAKYLDCAIRSGEYYISAMRHDGGLFRGTYRDFNTNSFGQETSGIECAVILWHGLWKLTYEDRWLAAMSKALNYCMRLQFTEPSDPNLRGAILSTVMYPDGTDRLPYHLRDLGTIFFVQAVAGVLGETPERATADHMSGSG